MAHEFKRADYRNMLRDITIPEYFAWYGYFGKRPFTLDLIDYGYGAVASAVYNTAAAKQITSARDFSLLIHHEVGAEMTDEEMMAASGANAGVLRIEPD